MRRVLLVGIVLTAVSTMALCGDWPQWRGPNRTGAVSDSPKLADHWGKKGPELVWKSDPIPSGDVGGLGSPVVVDGKLVLYVNWGTILPLKTRTITEQALRQIGWVPDDKENRPQPLFDMVEKARLSDERAALTKQAEIATWTQKWMDANLIEQNIEVKINDPKMDQKSKNQQVNNRFNWLLGERLRKGKDAPEFAELDRLMKSKDKQFADEKAFAAWLDENKFDIKLAKALMDNVAKTYKTCQDTLLCLDAATGKQLWRKDYPCPIDYGWGISVTPTVINGKIYLVGSTLKTMCFNLKDGKLLWEKKLLDPRRGPRVDSSFLLVDDTLIILADRLTGLDVANGELKWKHPNLDCNDNSPVLWTFQGKKYVICNTANGTLGCVQPDDGRMLWTTAGGGCSTTAIEGDTMAVLSGNPDVGLTAYKLTPGEAKKISQIKGIVDRGASPLIHDGYVYAIASGKAICMEVATGKTMWTGNVGGGEISSPILVDGKIIAPVAAGNALAMIKASPDKFEMLANVPVPVAYCTSPAFADGKLYLRLKDCVACYDLTKEPAEKP